MLMVHLVAMGSPDPAPASAAFRAWLERNRASSLPRAGRRLTEPGGITTVCFGVQPAAAPPCAALVLVQALLEPARWVLSDRPGSNGGTSEATGPQGTLTPSSDGARVPRTLFRRASEFLHRQVCGLEDLLRREAAERSPGSAAECEAEPGASGPRTGASVSDPAEPGDSAGEGREVGLRTGRRARQIVNEMLAYMEEHYASRLTLKEVAEALKMNGAYLSSIFSRSMGVTFHRYLEEMRMVKAMELLRDPHSRVREVALAAGYASSDAFRHAFKAYTGTSPSDWRNSDTGSAEVPVQWNS